MKLNFSSLSLADKINIKENERPVPVLNLSQVQKAYKNRAGFDANVCEQTNASFCFVCLLFGGYDNWTKGGIRDLKHLGERIKKHAKSTQAYE